MWKSKWSPISDCRYPNLTGLITKSEKCVQTLCEIARDPSDYNYVKSKKKTRKPVVELAPTNSVKGVAVQRNEITELHKNL